MIINPYAFGAPFAPASFIFNGSDEALTRTLATAGASTTRFTYSIWFKPSAFPSGAAFQIIDAPTNDNWLTGGLNATSAALIEAVSGSNIWGENISGAVTNTTGVWMHLVYRYDSTDATADNRIRFYKNGTLITDANSTGGQPALNEAHSLFANGRQHQIGGWLDVADHFSGKMAFIDVLEGISADPTSFAFDNGGTWTRLNYAGSYGTYGFSLDGSDGFNDTSGNAQHFAGLNMTTGSNLDIADLPPYTN
jgi:hypothetical protein